MVQSVKCAQQFPNGGSAAALGLPGISMSIIPGWTDSSAFRATAAAGIAKENSQRLKLELKMSPLPTLTSVQHLLSGRDVLWDSL